MTIAIIEITKNNPEIYAVINGEIESYFNVSAVEMHEYKNCWEMHISVMDEDFEECIYIEKIQLDSVDDFNLIVKQLSSFEEIKIKHKKHYKRSNT
tara:strand:- start:175 stop:462 length:288 start_codon:yes stop_codon:yes gene_type:complete